MRPTLVPIRMVLASISRIAVDTSPEDSPRETVVHGGPPVLVTTREVAPMATVEPKTSTRGRKNRREGRGRHDAQPAAAVVGGPGGTQPRQRDTRSGERL